MLPRHHQISSGNCNSLLKSTCRQTEKRKKLPHRVNTNQPSLSNIQKAQYASSFIYQKTSKYSVELQAKVKPTYPSKTSTSTLFMLLNSKHKLLLNLSFLRHKASRFLNHTRNLNPHLKKPIPYVGNLRPSHHITRTT